MASWCKAVIVVVHIPWVTDGGIRGQGNCNGCVGLCCFCAFSGLEVFSIRVGFSLVNRALPVAIIASRSLPFCYALLSTTVSGFFDIAVGAVNRLVT